MIIISEKSTIIGKLVHLNPPVLSVSEGDC